MNKEYEYSFKVDDILPFVDYCKSNNYKFIKETNQTRTLYKNENKTMARITIEESNNVITKILDFKEDLLNTDILKERLETKELLFVDDESVLSILKFLKYEKDKTLIRKRSVYQKNNVVFEIDEYTKPEVAFVVAIEGEKL